MLVELHFLKGLHIFNVGTNIIEDNTVSIFDNSHDSAKCIIYITHLVAHHAYIVSVFVCEDQYLFTLIVNRSPFAPT